MHVLPFRDPLPGDMGDSINGVEVLDQLRCVAIFAAFVLLADTLGHLRVFDRAACSHRLGSSVFEYRQSKREDRRLPLLMV